MSNNNDRFPPNLKGLLKFALQYTKSEDAPSTSTWEQMDPERKQFLADALNSMTVDIIEEFEKALKILDDSNSSIADKVNALAIIEDYVDNIDFANNFIKIGGTRFIIASLDSDSAEIRMAAASVVAEMSQNNEYCQKHFLELNIIEKLVGLLTDEEKVACKCMHAISCMIRNYEPCLMAFIAIGGLECLLGCLGCNDEKLFIKVSFLIGVLSTEFKAVKDQFIQLGAIEKISEYVEPSTEYSPRLENTLSALNVLTENSKSCLPATLISKLKSIAAASEGKPEFEEILEYCKVLLTRCSTQTADR